VPRGCFRREIIGEIQSHFLLIIATRRVAPRRAAPGASKKGRSAAEWISSEEARAQARGAGRIEETPHRRGMDSRARRGAPRRAGRIEEAPHRRRVMSSTKQPLVQRKREWRGWGDGARRPFVGGRAAVAGRLLARRCARARLCSTTCASVAERCRGTLRKLLRVRLRRGSPIRQVSRNRGMGPGVRESQPRNGSRRA
jgi:hypothetical protein